MISKRRTSVTACRLSGAVRLVPVTVRRASVNACRISGAARRIPVTVRLAGTLVLGSSSVALDSAASDGPFEGGRLFLHYAESVEYVPGADLRGGSNGALCESAVIAAPSAGNVFVCYVVAAFPPRTSPLLRQVSFGIDYDPHLLQIVDYAFYGGIEERSTNWPEPDTSVHLGLGELRGRSIELLWFAVRPRTDQPAELRLGSGAFGGIFEGPGWDDLIEGFGSVGFGQSGVLECPPLHTCCLPDRSCELTTVYRCGQLEGFPFEGGADCGPCADTGACCMEWVCAIGVAAACADAGGEFQGAGTSCDPNACIPTGACCLAGGTCMVRQQTECPDSAFYPGETCSPSPCTFGACCYYEEFGALCVLTTEAVCLDRGSEYRGDGSLCDPLPCLPGICCVDSIPDCFYSAPEDCPGSFVPGSFGPPETACFVACCCGPTIDASWGSIKSTFRGAPE
jgi:hypothetical protein